MNTFNIAGSTRRNEKERSNWSKVDARSKYGKQEVNRTSSESTERSRTSPPWVSQLQQSDIYLVNKVNGLG